MRKGEATRQRIIAEAAPIFNRRGFAGCSLQELMDATGLEKGGIYRHFESKEELAVEAFRYALAQSVKVRTEHLEGIPGSVEKLREMVRRFVETPSAVVGGCPLMNTAIDADDGNPVLRELALQGIREWRERLAVIVREGVRRGEIKRGTQAKRVANTMIATLEGALMISRLEGSREALKDARVALDRMLDEIAA
jgi:AcrR family transcriptional regulator